MRKIWIGALAAALAISLGWGLNEYRLAGDYRLLAENNNRRALSDFASHLDQLETDMAKGDVASNSTQKILYLSQVSSKSDAALKDFAQIPADQVGLSYVGQFLTQSGDFARTLAQRVAGGETITAEEDKTLRDMHERLVPVNQKVQEMMTRMDTENLVWTDPAPTLRQRLGLGGPQIAEAAADGSEAPTKSVRSGLDQLDASLQKLPPFTYTGEYSSRVVLKPLGLPSGEVTRDQAQAVARNFLNKVGYANVTPEFAGDYQGLLGGYSWKYKDVYLQVSRQGGVVILYRDQRPIEPRTLSLEEGASKAKTVLQTLGWQLMLTSSENFGSYAQFDFVAEKDGVRIYPDKVRAMIALDNGQLVGLDAAPYYSFHQTRTFPAKLTMSQAERKLRQNFQVLESRLAVIAKSGNKEVYSYEFRGRYQGEEYLLYLNAVTGAEEKIQRIIKTPRGEFLQ
ncbi:PepSY1/2 domain-containing protein [Desulfosporosinus metallidurans]|uniref:Spore germination protein YpeB n=1 Tax=Desulfosporosinus metallidurans TaxID=1888891 RepID=A0A1Q8R335_9FIRM|nr:PepSY1/2 domain-containing protein [Desulfosporosinus metallidurans]OLN33968.1 Spore germination protein YpeB [Desulfosporosinus metallidurans]